MLASAKWKDKEVQSIWSLNDYKTADYSLLFGVLKFCVISKFWELHNLKS